jgi:DNA sulfur modification protein DndD
MSVFIRRLTIENFGPYLGRHVLELGSEPGVWVIYGENGRGKTSILNAFRYALYGEVLGRLGQKRPQDFVNRRHAENGGSSSFALQVDLRHGVDDYQISRSCSAAGV